MVKLQISSSFYLSVFLLFAIVLFSCSIDKDRKVEREKFTFKTGDDTLLFFKNVRQSDYDLEENDAAKLRIFRHEDRPEADSVLYLCPAIVISILRDEAYLLLEPSETLKDVDAIKVLLESIEAVDTIRLTTMNRDDNIEFATRIYEHLQGGGKFKINVDDSWAPFMVDEGIRESFRITMSDYYRLTRIY
jgi:hypothetical protein